MHKVLSRPEGTTGLQLAQRLAADDVEVLKIDRRAPQGRSRAGEGLSLSVSCAGTPPPSRRELDQSRTRVIDASPRTGGARLGLRFRSCPRSGAAVEKAYASRTRLYAMALSPSFSRW
jgi:hypothetical protein